MDRVWRRNSLSGLIVVMVSGVAMIILLLSVLIFTTMYTDALKSGAAISSAQAVNQAANTISNYTKDTNQLLRRITMELDEDRTAENIAEDVSTMIQMRDDLIGIAVYSASGALIDCWSDGRTRKPVSPQNALALPKLNGNQLYIAPPHVQNLYHDYYPWVITIARQASLRRYDRTVYVTADLQFSSIADYVDGVGLGQHGYLFIIDEKGNLIYHPQQQLIYSGLKSEDTTKYAGWSDGTHTEGNTICVIQPIGQEGWRLVGLSYLDELVEQPLKNAMRMIVVLVPAAMAALLIVVVLIVRIVSHPILRLVREMRDFELDAAKFSYQPVSGTMEISILSESFGHMVARIQHLMAEAKAEEQTLRKVELKALQAQINPHFLYNTLDSIQWMCEMNRVEDAVKMVGALARLFRISISRDQELIPIRKEIEHAECYLIIQKFRYKDQFSYRFDVDPSMLNCMCSKITLQPIIENAILHGFGEFVEDGEIFISAKAEVGAVVLTVQDNGVGMVQEKCRSILLHETNGIGLKNVDDRIRIYFGTQYGITVTSELDKGTKVTIRLPQVGGNSDENT